MKYGVSIVIGLLCVLLSSAGYAQGFHWLNSTDSIMLADTVQSDKGVYKALHNAASKRQWTKNLYDLLFNDPNPQVLHVNEKKSIETQYIAYDKRPIRSINIVRLSPFGTSVNNPDTTTANGIIKSLNSTHINTQKIIIQGNLLFKKGDLVNPLTIAENEAYLRSLGFVSDARIHISAVPYNDSVDVDVIVRDKFSIGFELHNASLNGFDAEVYDRNFIGMGSNFSLRYMHNANKTPTSGFGVNYSNPNIFRTFVRLELSYLKDYTTETFKASLERAFQYHLKYLGGLSYVQSRYPIWLSVLQPIGKLVDVKNEYVSATLGRSFNINHKDAVGDKFVVTGRYMYRNLLSDLPETQEPYLYYPYEKRSLYLTSFTFFRQRYYRSSMIYNFGVTEDIAYGYNFTSQVGYEKHSYFERMYASMNISAGQQFKSGYYYGSAGYGSYFRNSKSEQGVLKLYANYYTPLLSMGRNYVRQFVAVDYTLGVNRLPSEGEKIYFSQLTNLGTSAFNNEANGTHRFTVNTESEWFTPLRVIGFRFVFFAFANVGWINGNNLSNLFSSQNFFSGYGVGFRTRNDQLVFKTIEIKLGWYPRLSQNSFNDYYNFSTSNPKISPNFKPEYPDVIPFR